MSFDRPYFLFLLLLLPWVPVVLRWSLTGFDRKKQMLLSAMRAAALAALILAMAGPHFDRSTHDLSVVYLVDGSASISEEALDEARAFVAQSRMAARPGDQTATVLFAGEAHLAESRETLPDEERLATNIDAALELGAAATGDGRAPRLVLLSDGNETSGDSEERARLLAARGIPVDTVPLHNPFTPEVLVDELETPMRQPAGEPFHVRAWIKSNVETPARVLLYRDQFLVAEKQIDLSPGRREVRFENQTAGEGVSTFEVDIRPETDTRPENNRLEATVVSRGPPRVLISDSRPGQLTAVRSLLEREGFEVDLRPPEALPTQLSDLQRYDLLILSDLPASYLSGRQMELYQRWVRELGGGLLMAGGENSFGAGGWLGASLGRILPVAMDQADREERPTVALMVILDRSGSMGASVGGGNTKLSLANRGAVMAMRMLEEQDYISVLAVDTRIHEVVPMSRVRDTDALERQIMSITAGGGGIYILTSLIEARQQMRRVDAGVKHLIIFSDAADAEEKYAGEMADGLQSGGDALDVAAGMAAQQITTSVVALGYLHDRDTAWLRTLAGRGGGRFYLTGDAAALPEIFAAETNTVVQTSLVEEPVAVRAIPGSPVAEGVSWSEAPYLLGYNKVRAKPAAEIHLVSEYGDPLLTTWRYGLGRVGAWAPDAKSRWAAEWLRWGGFAQFWIQTARHLARTDEPTLVETDFAERDGVLEAVWDFYQPDGRFFNDLHPAVSVLYFDGRTQSLPVGQTAPGRYRADIPIESDGAMVISLSAEGAFEAPYLAGWTPGFPKEFRALETDEEKLRAIADITGGRFAPNAETIFRDRESAVTRRTDLGPWLIALALLVLPAEILARRRFRS